MNPMSPNERLTSAGKRVAKLRLALLSAGVLVGLLLAVFWSVSGLATDRVCLSCHSRLQSEFALDESHARFRCYSCHLGAGWERLAARKRAEARMLLSVLRGAETTPVALLGQEPCLGCHASVMREPSEGGAIRVAHSSCVREGTRCTDCHGGLVHGGHEGRVVGTYSMDVCVSCHDGMRASVSCDLCHRGRSKARRVATAAWRITHGPNWRSAHGAGDLGTCMVCHDRSKCKRCHGVSLPHVAGYQNTHRSEASVRRESCDSCHETSFCDGCHGLPMPHPQGFLPAHPDESRRRGEAACLRCHEASDCESCHTEHAHPGRVDRDG